MNSKGWNAHVHRGLSGKFELINLSEDNFSREIGPTKDQPKRDKLAAAADVSRLNLGGWIDKQTSKHVNTHTHMYIHIYMCICICVCMCVSIYIYIHV